MATSEAPVVMFDERSGFDGVAIAPLALFLFEERRQRPGWSWSESGSRKHGYAWRRPPEGRSVARRQTTDDRQEVQEGRCPSGLCLSVVCRLPSDL